MDSNDRIVYAIAAFPVAGIVAGLVSAPLDLPLVARLAIGTVLWWAIYQFTVRRWPEG